MSWKTTGKFFILVIVLVMTMVFTLPVRAQNLSLNFSLDNLPNVTNVSASSIGIGTATITWFTDKLADSQIEYGMDTGYGQITALNSILTLSHSQAISSLSGGTTYHYRLLSADASGFLRPSMDYTFTTTQQQSGNGDDNNPGGSTGGSTGGSPKINTSVNTSSGILSDSMIISIDRLDSGQAVTRSIPSEFGIRSITLTGTVQVYSIRIVINKINTANIPVPFGKVYKYIRFDAINTDQTIKEILYDVDKQWMIQNNFTKDEMKFLRLTTQWDHTQTSNIGENTTHYNYRAVLPGFSIFAIVGEKIADTIKNEQTIVVSNTTAGMNTANNSSIVIPPLVDARSGISVPNQYFIISGVLFLVAILLYLYYHHKRTRQAKENYPSTVPRSEPGPMPQNQFWAKKKEKDDQ